MREMIVRSLVMLLLLTLLAGIAYPLVVTGIAQVFFPAAARGSLIVLSGRPAGSRSIELGGRTIGSRSTTPSGRPVGSRLIGQSFTGPRYFWGRPSATTPPYNAAASTGSNLGPSSKALDDSLRARLARLEQADPDNRAPVPVDLVTASASGLDPDLSPAAALYQVPRVARARGLGEEAVRALVQRHIQGRQLGILGEPRVNVLRLNLALDALPVSP